MSRSCCRGVLLIAADEQQVESGRARRGEGRGDREARACASASKRFAGEARYEATIGIAAPSARGASLCPTDRVQPPPCSFHATFFGLTPQTAGLRRVGGGEAGPSELTCYSSTCALLKPPIS